MRTAKKIILSAVTAVLIAVLALPVFASTQTGKITVTLEDKNKNRVSDLTVYACQIASLDSTGYYPTKAFENSGISISGIINNPNEAAAKTVAEFAVKNNAQTLSQTAQNGKVTFTELDLGIWVVFPEQMGKYTFNPYIVLLPYESGGLLCFEVTSSPKLEDNTPNVMSVYVLKKWDDKNNASKKRPELVTVELLNGDSIVATVELSEQNGWAHTFSKLPKSDKYSVREKAVEDYKTSYSGDASNGFVITNTYDGEKLPQTGQHWWPIILIAVAGAGFVLLGICEIGAKKNGKKK